MVLYNLGAWILLQYYITLPLSRMLFDVWKFDHKLGHFKIKIFKCGSGQGGYLKHIPQIRAPLYRSQFPRCYQSVLGTCGIVSLEVEQICHQKWYQNSRWFLLVRETSIHVLYPCSRPNESPIVSNYAFPEIPNCHVIRLIWTIQDARQL